MQTIITQDLSIYDEVSLTAEVAASIIAPTILFIDPTIDDVDTLINGVQPNVRVITLDPHENGIQQITQTLQHHQEVEAIHIVAHGQPGCLSLGNVELTLDNINSYTSALKSWMQLSKSPPLLLYSCNLAAGDIGNEFQKRLHRITNLPIAASQTKIGSSALGGNWQLEEKLGAHPQLSHQVFTRKAKASYAGILASTQLVKDINPRGDTFRYGDADPSPADLIEVNGKLFFTVDDGNTGRELWVSDGTEPGTQRVKDINPRRDSNRIFYDFENPNPASFIEVDGKLFFTAIDGDTGRELWVSDGTTTGTLQVKDINPRSDTYRYGDDDPSPADLIEVDGKLFFTVDDGIRGRELWVSDGTEPGTQLVKDINPRIGSYPSSGIEVDGKLFFTADDFGAIGRELWVSDGTEAGTQLVKDINPTRDSFSFPTDFIEVDGKLFFTANDGIRGLELWVSDGTEAGTQLVKDINPTGSDDFPFPTDFIEVDGKLFFIADDGIRGRELWVSDGTEAGTQLVKDINPRSGDFPFPTDFIEVDGKLFFTADDGTTGLELWVSDGTEAGTQLVKDINPKRRNSAALQNFTDVDGKLFFTANDGIRGLELWVSDGTEAGTQLVKDINPKRDRSSSPTNLIEVDGKLFFTADDGTTGRELWVSDGTEAGTQLFKDINLGAKASSPNDITIIGNNLFFNANDGINGRELWMASVPDNIIVGDEDNNVLNGTVDNDFLSGLEGNDVIRGRRGDDQVKGDEGNDVLFGDQGNDAIEGGAGNDQIFGDRGADSLEGGAGDDIVNAGAGNDIVTVRDFSGIDTFDGGGGNDLIRFDPTDGRDLTIFLDRGQVGDRARGGQIFENFEQIVTGRGNDRLLGNGQSNTLDGGSGNDELRGEAGQDDLTGGLGGDTLIGGQGADVLNGGTGDDVLIGDGGADTFQFDQDLLDGRSDTNTIQDFQARDILDFAGYIDAGGSIEATRVTSEFLRIDLSSEDILNIFGSSRALDIAETQL
ncbi:ELWxxDGT repeat protein [Acaryochloris sp. IP29b_bin.148]|uniref:ELWxxDGT repeat protein n=1 Tax=Acaryochloris sp. IP29b_bin.148 TaxID=2969218 RepID=UPI00260B9F5D|nr:ELWxxDGT repeat protein [Acaryochloris sp. IP29b_bin.148]